MEHAAPIITLTSDFGLSDPYVGQMKGALLKGCPFATLIDITHTVAAWNVLAAAITLFTSYRHFPAKTVHLIVVDPGVGGSRSILAAQGDGHFFVCPDNGILSLLLAEEKIQRVHRVTYSAFAEGISPTFHGRDIMAPVAAALARGEGLHAFGDALVPSGLTRITFPLSSPCRGMVQVQVLSVDHFGNVRISIRPGEGGGALREVCSVKINGFLITKIGTCYSQVPVGHVMLLVDSVGFLEIAANQASAAAFLGCAPGDQLSVEFVQK